MVDEEVEELCRVHDVGPWALAAWRGWWDRFHDPASDEARVMQATCPQLVAVVGKGGWQKGSRGWLRNGVELLLGLQRWTGGRRWSATRWARLGGIRQKTDLARGLDRLDSG